jgi:hypothetical protein
MVLKKLEKIIKYLVPIQYFNNPSGYENAAMLFYFFSKKIKFYGTK